MTNQQTDTKTTERIVTISLKRFKALMKLAGQLIDPATAEVDWIYAYTLDPYGLYPDALSPEEHQSGREHFARNPGSDIWVSFDDLPEATRNALRHKKQPSFSFGGGPLQWNIADIPTKITF